MSELASPITKLYYNKHAAIYHCDTDIVDPRILPFHASLPHYSTTPLIELPDIAAELGVGRVFLKLEAQRLGLPSFKILGASWAIYRAVAKAVDIPIDDYDSFAKVAEAAHAKKLRLVTCTDGNWGRSVGRMAKYLGIEALVFVPEDIDSATRNKIRSEGANVKCEGVEGGDYDDAVRQAIQQSNKSPSDLLVLDTSWESYKEVPYWVTQGYSTMLLETDTDLACALQRSESHGETIRNSSDKVVKPTIVIASVGVGSWAHAVTAYYKQTGSTKVVTVEPETAASLLTSLHYGRLTPIKTKSTIMNGMNCGTTSYIAWPVLKNGVDMGITITDLQSHEALEKLRTSKPIVDDIGPCGAAPLAALSKLVNSRTENGLKLSTDDVVVLFGTEGKRDYIVPTQSKE